MKSMVGQVAMSTLLSLSPSHIHTDSHTHIHTCKRGVWYVWVWVSECGLVYLSIGVWVHLYVWICLCGSVYKLIMCVYVLESGGT